MAYAEQCEARTDNLERVKEIVKLVQAGLMSADDAAKHLGLPIRPGAVVTSITLDEDD